MITSLEQRMLYRSKLITYYFNNQKIKDMAVVRRQVNNLDDRGLEKNYNLIFDAQGNIIKQASKN